VLFGIEPLLIRQRVGPGRRCVGAFFFFFLLVLLLMAFQVPARAAEDQGAELRARTYFGTANYKEALEIYARLYAETLHPTYLRNIARCYQNLGEPDKAISSFQEYLRKAKNLSREQRAEVEGYIAEMEQMKRSRAIAAVPARPAPASPPATLPRAMSSPVTSSPDKSPPALLDSPAVVTKRAPDSEPGPVYTRWWFWATVAAVAAVGVTSVVLLSADRSPSHGDLGALDLTDKRP
jgi:tetratricopeptide (TPR) repeat protein